MGVMDENEIKNIVKEKIMTYHIAIIGSGPSAFMPLRRYLRQTSTLKWICLKNYQPHLAYEAEF